MHTLLELPQTAELLTPVLRPAVCASINEIEVKSPLSRNVFPHDESVNDAHQGREDDHHVAYLVHPRGGKQGEVLVVDLWAPIFGFLSLVRHYTPYRDTQTRGVSPGRPLGAERHRFDSALALDPLDGVTRAGVELRDRAIGDCVVNTVQRWYVSSLSASPSSGAGYYVNNALALPEGEFDIALNALEKEV